MQFLSGPCIQYILLYLNGNNAYALKCLEGAVAEEYYSALQNTVFLEDAYQEPLPYSDPRIILLTLTCTPARHSTFKVSMWILKSERY